MFIFCLIFAFLCQAQELSAGLRPDDPGQVHVLQTLRGDVFVGRILDLTSGEVRFSLRGQMLVFQRSELNWIGSLEEWSSKVTKPSSAPEEIEEITNLIYSPTAFSLPKGKGEYRNIDLLWNTVDFGLGDHFSLGGGALIPYFLIVRAKGAFEISPQFRLGLGMNTFLSTNIDFSGFVSHGFLIATAGPADRFLNLTLGYGWDWELFQDRVLIGTLGGGISISNRWRIHLDMGFIPGEGSSGILPTITAAWQKKRNRIEFGVIGIPDPYLPVFPLLSYTGRF